MDTSSIASNKLLITYSYQGKKYKLPFESENKTIGELKAEIVRRLNAINIEAKADDHHLEDKDGAQFFEEDLVKDFLEFIKEIKLTKKSSASKRFV